MLFFKSNRQKYNNTKRKVNKFLANEIKQSKPETQNAILTNKQKFNNITRQHIAASSNMKTKLAQLKNTSAYKRMKSKKSKFINKSSLADILVTWS